MTEPLWPKCLHCKEYLDAGDSKKFKGFCSIECKKQYRAERGLRNDESDLQ